MFLNSNIREYVRKMMDNILFWQYETGLSRLSKRVKIQTAFVNVRIKKELNE